ncbi:MAG: ATP-binding protein, partial [Acidimicrobiia bacterium]
AASSPTGPAFEGAQISSGQRAAPGAIERVRIDRSSLEPRFSVIGQEAWSDEPGFEFDSVTGICGSGIIEAIAELFLAGVVGSDGVVRDPSHSGAEMSTPGSTSPRQNEHSPRVVPSDRTFSYVLCFEPRIEVTQNDVRAVQLAKAALHAGARLLMDHYGIDRVDEIRLAGAFGSHIDPMYAMVLGMIPDCDLDRVSAAGNAAGVGAMMALLSGVAREEIEAVAARIEKVETAVEPRFQEHFVAALAIPHETDPYPLLSAVVEMPPTAGPRGRRGRRSQ